MGTIQSQLNQLELNGPQGSVHAVTHNHSPGNHPPDKIESYCWLNGLMIKMNTQVLPVTTTKISIKAQQTYTTEVVVVINGVQQEPIYDDMGM